VATGGPTYATGPTYAGAGLGPGVVVRSINTQRDSMSNSTIVNVEMYVDPTYVDLNTLMARLSDAIKHSTAGMSVMTMASTGTASPWQSQVLLQPEEETTEHDPEVVQEEVTLVSLKELIEERLDGIDSAIRLAVGE